MVFAFAEMVFAFTEMVFAFTEMVFAIAEMIFAITEMVFAIAEMVFGFALHFKITDFLGLARISRLPSKSRGSGLGSDRLVLIE